MSNALKISGALGLAKLELPPASPENGFMYYDTALNKVRQYANGSWQDVAAGTITPEFQTDTFRIQDGIDLTKELEFDVSQLSSGQTRTLIMPNYNVEIEKMLPSGAVRVASTEDLILAGLQTIDGVSLANDDSVLVKDQIDPTENGVYFVRASSWERLVRLKSGDVINVFEGDYNKGNTYSCNTNFPFPTFGADNISFDLISFNAFKSVNGTAANAVAVDNVAVLSGTTTIDDVTLNNDDFILLSRQTDPIENGLWRVKAGAWERATEIVVGRFLLVFNGTRFAQSSWRVGSNTPFPPIINYGVDEVYVTPISYSVEKVIGRARARVVSYNNETLSGLPTIDSVTLMNNQIALLINQTDPIENGLWRVKAGAWERVTDYTRGSVIFVSQGVDHNKETFLIDADATFSNLINFGIDAIYPDKIANNPDNVVSISGLIKDDGTVPMTADLNLGTNKIVNVVDPTADQDVATKKYVDDNAGTGVFVGGIVLEDFASSKQLTVLPGASMSTNISITLPSDQGTTGQVLQTNGSGVTSWVSIGNSDVFADDVFRVQDNSDATKQLAFEVSTISSATTRTITMPDADVNLSKVNNAILKDGSVVMTANLDLGTNKIVNVVDPIANQDAATKKYVDDEINGLPDPIVYKGTYNASTNTPALANADTGKTGFLYQVTVAGSRNFGAGSISFEPGDRVVNNGTTWDKWDMTDAVNSVNGQTGVVVLSTTDIAEGTNLYYTTGRFDTALATKTTDNLTEGTTNKYFSVAAARAAAVADAIVDGVTDVAPSQNAVFDALALKASTTLNNLGTTSINANLIPDTASSRNIGSSAKPFSVSYVLAGAFGANGTDYTGIINRGGSISRGGDSYVTGYFAMEADNATAKDATIGSANRSNATGRVLLYSGSSVTSGDSGQVKILTGDAVSGNSGNLFLQVGTASSTRGQISLDARRIFLAGTTTIDVNGNAIEGAASEILLAGQNAVRRAKQASKSSFIEEEYIHAVALSASQTNTVISAFTFAFATVNGVEICYKVQEATSGDIRIGTMRVVTDGTNVSINDMSTETADTGVTFDAVVNGANINIRYSSGTNGATMRADVKKFLV